MMIAMLASVTVSMGELTTGEVNLIFFVSCVARLTCKQARVNAGSKPGPAKAECTRRF